MTNPPAPEGTSAPASVMHNPEVVEVETTKVSCDGGGGALGHPKVYYDMGEDDFVECGYCDRRFVLKAGARHG